MVQYFKITYLQGRRYRAWIDDFYSQWNGKSSIKQLQSAEVCGNIFDDYEIVKNYDKDCYSALKSAHKRTRLPVNAPVHVKEAARYVLL